MSKLFKNKILAATYIVFGFLFWHLGAITLKYRPDGWYAGHVNLYGDLLLHLAFISKFLQNDPLFTQSPIFASAKPNYPPMADFITAQIARLTGISNSLLIVTFIVGLVLIFSVRKLIFNFVKNETIVFITLLLFLFNGGFGFIFFFEDYLASGKPITDFIFTLPREYTNIQPEGYWWINSLLAYFLPQRGFLFAFPITLLVFHFLYQGIKHKKYHQILIAAVLTGVLPLFQLHSLIVIFFVCIFCAPASIFLTTKKPYLIKAWFVYGALSLIIVLPIFGLISDHTNALEFIKYRPGWTSHENIFLFWFKNLGLFLPILLISLMWLFLKRKKLFLLYLPFVFIFIISNLFIFQPWDFDNSKLLIYWYFASCVVVSYFIYWNLLKDAWPKKLFAALLILIMTFSSAIDIFRTFTSVTYYKILSNTDIDIASQVKTLTPRNAIFITAHNHNNPIVSVAGRSTLLGFQGWVWSHGFNYYQREEDIKKIYAGVSNANNLISNYKISYITVGPMERQAFSINENYLKNFPVINLGEGWKIYDVSALWSNSSR